MPMSVRKRSYLNDSFEPLSPLNCTKWPENATDTKDLQYGDCASAGVEAINCGKDSVGHLPVTEDYGNKGDSNHEHVQQICWGKLILNQSQNKNEKNVYELFLFFRFTPGDRI